MGGMTTPTPGWLAELAPAHAPPPVSVWPPAPGWWGLALLGLVLIGVALWWWRHPQRRLRHEAGRLLRAIEQQGDEPLAQARALENLLRRYALACYGRERVARLSGQAWLDFLEAEGGRGLGGASGQALLRLVYAEQGSFDAAACCAAARAFVRRARPRRAGASLPQEISR